MSKKILDIILHCSDSKYGNAALIDSWHREQGWSMIGYHYVILNGNLSKDVYNINFNGHIETGRPFNDNDKFDPFEIGAHTRGHNNALGICLIGMSGLFTALQILSAYDLVNMLEEQFHSHEIVIKQHSEYDNKKSFCAGLDMEAFRKEYRRHK